MNSIYFTTILILSTILLLLAKEQHEDNGQIRQCTCTELSECNADLLKKLRPCKEKCLEKLELSDWNGEQGRKCFIPKENNKTKCMEDLKKTTCAAEDGILINKNETLHHHGHKKHHKKNSAETSTKPSPRHGGMRSKLGFFDFIRNNFGESAKEYIKCTKECTKGHRRGNCVRELKCGIKRLSPTQLKLGFDKCRSENVEKHQQLCACLEKAGAKHIECNAKAPISSESSENKLN